MQRAQERANNDPGFRALGSADATVYFQSGKHARRVTFEAFQIEAIESVQPEDLDLQDIVISMTSREWNSYLHQRRLKRAPSLLAMPTEKKVVVTKDTMTRLAYERISKSVQAFIDYGANAI